MSEADSKKLADLRVVDLRAELEKRDLDTSGVKAVLLKKLHKALVDEGHDPETYVFQLEGKGTPVKQGSKRKENVSEEDMDEKSNEKVEPPTNEEEEVKDQTESKESESKENGDKQEEKPSAEENKEEKETSSNETEVTEKDVVEDNSVTAANEDNVEKTEEPSVASDEKSNDEVKPDEITEKSDETDTEKNDAAVDKSNDDEKEVTEEPETTAEDTTNEASEDADKSDGDIAAKEAELEKLLKEDEDADLKDKEEEEEEEDPKDYEGDDVEEMEESEHHGEDESKTEDKNENDMNGLDNEDSINLTLGEEDEKLMAGEVDLLTKDGKDLKERGVSRLTSSKKQGSAQDQQRKTDARNASPDKAADDKAKKSNYRNLWVSGLSSITRATDLKHVFSKLGKVVAAKVVTNAKTPGARCYGFVTMATSEDAQNCIKGLNLTELHGRLISVEAVANKPNPVDNKKKASDERKRTDERSRIEERKKDDSKRKIELSPKVEEKRRKRANSETLVPPGTEDMVDENGEGAEGEKLGDEGSEKGGGPESIRGVESDARSRSSRGKSRDRRRRSISPRRHPPGVLSFSQIKEERERARARERERAAREEERRRESRQRVLLRKQREEAARLEREREKIRIERERLERERTELLRLERERLEREKEELKRQQLKLEEARRNKRTLSTSRDGYDERKRLATESSRRYDPVHLSPPARDYKKESRRDISPPVRGRYEEPTRSSRREEPRVKERVYSERGAVGGGSSGTFRSRDERERRDETGHRIKSESSRGSHRSDGPGSKGDRYASEGWSGGVSKSGFSGVSGGGRDAWNMSQDRKPDVSPWARPPAQSDRWASNSSMMVSGGRSGPMYPPGMTPMPSSMGMPMSSGYQQGERFDAYKPMGSAPRKY